MKYKTLKSSETGKKFSLIYEKSCKAHDETVALSEELNFETCRIGYWCAYGGISCVMFEETPDKNIWKSEKDGYTPKLNNKVGKEIAEKFNQITSVSYDELNQCIGYDGAPWKHIGVNFNNKLWVGFETDEKWKVKVPKDCEEITITEYNQLFSKR